MPLEVIWPAPGRYVVAVSGGADSMVLLDVLAAAAGARDYELTVAHFDHGLRADSAADAAFVAAAAAAYGLAFEHAAAHLGRASEATARGARHAWLGQVAERTGAAAILTAHHQDDLLETSLLNLARGTGRRGLAPMLEARRGGAETRRGGAGDGRILRPLLCATRAGLRAYAAARGVTWREDPTNADLANPRNLLRHRLLPAAGPQWRAAYLQLIGRLAALNAGVDAGLAAQLDAARTAAGFAFDRAAIRSLSPAATAELILAAARQIRPGVQLDRRLVRDATTLAHAGRTGNQRPLRQDLVLMLTRSQILLTTNGSH